MLSKVKDHVADTTLVGIALAIVGGAGGFSSDGILGGLVGLFSGFGAGVGIGIVLVAKYSRSSGRGQPGPAVSLVNTGPQAACTDE